MFESIDNLLKKELMKSFTIVLQNISKNANDKQICYIDILINEIANSSINKALEIEKSYNENKLEGVVYCLYKATDLLGISITDLIEMFDLHDQIFITKNKQIYKLHLTRENVYKLFLG